MFFPFFTLLALSIVASVAGAPSNGPASTNVARDDSSPTTELKFRSYIFADLNFRNITVPEGIRVNREVKGGNWTNLDGSLLATVVSGLGGFFGYTDSNGVFHLDGRYTVQFVADKKWGYIEGKGFGTLGIVNKVFATLESDSASAKGLTEQTFYAPGQVVDGVLVAPHWAFV